jgi:BREX system ATP-binding protein BrxC/D
MLGTNMQTASSCGISAREREAIIRALRAGVVPKLGLQHIQVGRARELEATVGDVESVAQGGATLRFIIGEYGAGKTLFLNLVRLIALERNMAVVAADLGPSRRVHASGGEARLLFGDLVGSLAIRRMPEGGALAFVVEQFVAENAREAQRNGLAPSDVLQRRLAPLRELSFGFDFAAVLIRYGHGYEEGDQESKTAALRWLRAEYANRSEARAELGVRNIIDDIRFYDCLKLFARFVTLAGYDGLLVALDEMVNLYKLNSTQARNANYEQLLRMANDVLQGHASHIGFLMGGTPDFLMDGRRGLYRYPALQSRLSQNRFVWPGLSDCTGPVVYLEQLTPEHFFVLLTKIRGIFDSAEPGRLSLPDEALAKFMEHCSTTLGDTYFRTPRQTVTAFVNLLSVLEQNPGVRWQDLIGKLSIAREMEGTGPRTAPTETEHGPSAGDQDDGLASFRL